jgi:hypothetical protein
MRGKAITFIAAIFIISFWVIPALPQTEEPKPQLILVEEVAVKPAKVTEWEAHVKQAVELFTKYEFPYQLYTFSYNDFCCRFAWTIENFADIDNFYKAIGEWEKKMGPEQWESLMKSAIGTLDDYHYFLIRYRPDLSYIPEELGFDLWKEGHFVFVEFCYLNFGTEKEYEEITKKWVDLYKNKSIPVGWWTYVGDIGTSMPFYMFVIRAKSAADYYSQSEKMQKLLGEEIKKLMGKTWSPVRKYETKTGSFRPDLSYLPKGKKSTE